VSLKRSGREHRPDPWHREGESLSLLALRRPPFAELRGSVTRGATILAVAVEVILVTRFKVGVQIRPQHTTMDVLRRAWREADAMGVDTIFTWDHFYPLYGPEDGAHFEGWSMLAAMACDTEQAHFGMMVTCNSYRNPDLLADIARTVDHLSHGRLILGIGSGWFERDYDAYGYEFGTAIDRLHALGDALPRIEARLQVLNPPPVQSPLPILIGGAGEKVTLRIVAEHANLWNTFGPPENFAKKNAILNEWCGKVGRDPAQIERTVMIRGADDVDNVEDYLEAGAQHIILGVGTEGEEPIDLKPLRRLLDARG